MVGNATKSKSWHEVESDPSYQGMKKQGQTYDSWVMDQGKRDGLGLRWSKMDELTLVKVDQKVNG